MNPNDPHRLHHGRPMPHLHASAFDLPSHGPGPSPCASTTHIGVHQMYPGAALQAPAMQQTRVRDEAASVLAANDAKRPRLGVHTGAALYAPSAVSPTDVTAFFDPQQQHQHLVAPGAVRVVASTKTTPVTPTFVTSVEEEQEQEIDPDQLRQILDTMWEEQSREKLQRVSSTPMPDLSQSLKTSLLAHQVDGIRWLVHQETSLDTALPMYTLREYSATGTKRWISKITGQYLPREPTPIHGALLADDLGLGKTIQTLGLMLANPPGQPNAPCCTLVVCPVSVLGNWTEQIDMHLQPNTFRVQLYAGNKRKRSLLVSKVRANLIDILLVSYETLRSDYSDHLAKRKWHKSHRVNGETTHTTIQSSATSTGAKEKVFMDETLLDVKFHRIVLDEAHTIRNATRGVSHAAKKIQAATKLCLTGTPFVNQPDDMHSLLAFLGVESISDPSVFRDKITMPIKAGRAIGLSRLRTAISHVTLRRTKATANIQMVPKVKRIVKISFPEGTHKNIHDDLFVSSKTIFDALYADDEESNTFKTSGKRFELILRIRQACCSGSLVPRSRRMAAKEVAREVKNLMGPVDRVQAQVLLDRLTASHDADDTANTMPMGIPPKVSALLKVISDMKPDEKGVIFSQFVGFLDIVGRALEVNGHSVTRITGCMNAMQRIESMEAFGKEDANTSPRFMLCQLKAVGQGINLDRGNVVFMMDLWWNEAAQDQAMDRCHRLSSKRDVRVYSFVMKDTIEDRLLHVQKRKATLGKGTLQRLTEEEERHARLTAIKDLFDFVEAKVEEVSV